MSDTIIWPNETVPALDWLLVVRDEATRDELVRRTLAPGTFGLGCARGNDIIVFAVDVSRQHCAITIPHGSEWPRIMDVGSGNGTTINGRALLKGVETRVLDGDVVLIAGKYRLVLSCTRGGV